MKWKRRITMIGIVIGTYAIFRWVFPVAIPFLLAWFLAELFYPLASKIERKCKIKKTITGFLLLGISLAVAGALLFWGMKELAEQVEKVLQQVPVMRIRAEELLDDGCAFLEEATGIKAVSSRKFVLAKAASVQEEMTAIVLPGIFGGLLSGAKGILFLISGCVVTFISYLLLIGEMEEIQRKVREYLWLCGLKRVWSRLKATTLLYVKAQLVIIAAVSIVCAAGLWLMKNPYFLLLGIALAVLDAFPIIGTGAFLYPAAVILLFRGEYVLAAGCVILDLLTSVLREVLEPKLLGKKLGIPSIFILAAVYAGVFLYGAAGVILGPLSFSAMYELGREWDVWGT